MNVLWHDWASSYKITLKYETVIWESHLGKEQRRSLRTTPIISIAMNVMVLDHADMQDYLGREWEYVYIPLEMYDFTGVRGGTGSKIVTITSDVSNNFFLKHVSGLYLIDEDGNIAKIISVVGSTITLNQDIAGTSNNFWPAIKSFTKNVNTGYVTSRYGSSQLSFEQVKE